MKHLKKLAGCLLALVMILTMSNVAVVNAANGTNDNSGSITINNAIKGHTYNAYQILVLESYNTDKGAYAYKANPDWADWLASQKQYVSIDDQGYVTWVKDADAAAFAKAALAHAEESSINPVKTEEATGTTVNFIGLNLGYYLIDTTLGTLCSLDTTKPSVEMYEKNEKPSVTKEVQEDSKTEQADGGWGNENTAEIGDTVNFRTTISAKPGAQGYVLHDVMSAGLTLNLNSIEATRLTKGQDAENGDYHVVTTGFSDGCTFEIVFHQSYLDTITTDTDIVVTYSAVVNENALIYDDVNTNKTKLNYGDDSDYETTWKETKTYSFSFDIVKTDSDNELLAGAEFELYDAKTGGNKIPLVKERDGIYRVATEDEKKAEGFASAVIQATNGKATVKGFDDNTIYWLEETKAPDGYNKLAGRVEVEFGIKANISTSMTGNTWVEGNGGVHIVNKTGSLLPGTGGMGTTVLYIAGGVLVIAAGALLIFRRRMHTDR
ncbi:MAG: SpaH/EbpB family LPXTG-anchored major pilin [Clostridiales bacterium]|nr:SpaH/EbpB family LPXTG-anchored major pilin [Clostridiales bacterium]